MLCIPTYDLYFFIQSLTTMLKMFLSNVWIVPNDMVKQLGILLALQGTALG